MVSIPSVVLDIRKHRNRARKIFPLISSPSCILHLSVIFHRNTQLMGCVCVCFLNRLTGIKSYATQMLLQRSESGQFLTSLNCCRTVSADMALTLESFTHQVSSKIVNKNSNSH